VSAQGKEEGRTLNCGREKGYRPNRNHAQKTHSSQRKTSDLVGKMRIAGKVEGGGLESQAERKKRK